MKPTVVILAAGENSRFFPLNTQTHKGALVLCGKPLIVRTLENLVANHFKDVVIVVSAKDYDGAGISGLLADYHFDLNIKYVLQPKALGMGDALLRAKDYLAGHFALIFPESMDAGDLLVQMMATSGAGGTLVVSYTKEPWLYGIVTLDGKRVTSIIEKPEFGTEPSNLMVHGIYYLAKDYLSELEKTTTSEYAFEAALHAFLQKETVTYIERVTKSPSLKFPWHLFKFQQAILAAQIGFIAKNAKIAPTAILDETQGKIVVEDGAYIGHCARIVGPCYIGKDVFIGDFSLVRASSFESNACVGVHSDVARSIIMQNSSMHNGFLGDSILGCDVNIGAGFITSNKRLDRQNIKVQVKEKTVELETNAFGTVIGNGAKLGVRVAVMPGKLIGSGALIYPGTVIYANVGYQQTVKNKQESICYNRDAEINLPVGRQV